MTRNTVLTVPHFVAVGHILATTDMIATVPRDLANVCRRYGDVRIVEPPIRSPVIAVHQFWHARFHKDPAIGWLRGVIQSLFTLRRD